MADNFNTLDTNLVKVLNSNILKNDFIDEVINKGALLVITDDANSAKQANILLVDDIKIALDEALDIIYPLLPPKIIAVTGTNGKEVNAKNCIVIMTSNLGSSDSERNVIGFGNQERTGSDDKALKELINQRAGLQLQIKAIDKQASDEAKKKADTEWEEAQKEAERLAEIEFQRNEKRNRRP